MQHHLSRHYQRCDTGTADRGATRFRPVFVRGHFVAVGFQDPEQYCDSLDNAGTIPRKQIFIYILRNMIGGKQPKLRPSFSFTGK